ncbi:MAG: T9SS type A sorting domain-containing protein [Rhodothermales bacterium]
MRLKNLLLVISASLTMVLASIVIVIACQPSPLPPTCPQSIYLAKFAPGIFVIPEDGNPFDVPIGMFPFVSWDNVTPGCSVPTSATLDVVLECTDTSGAMFVLGPETFAVPVPVTPGAQPPDGTTVDFPMPGGIMPSTCEVMASYEVGFGGGLGVNPLIGVGDLQICLVEPSPGDPSGDTPRLDFELLTPEPLPGRDGEPGTYTFHAGDQEYIYIRIENNDLENKLEIDFESIGRQMSIFPFLPEFDSDEEAYNAGVFRISEPDDVFPADFFFDDSSLPFDRVPGEPGGIGDGRIETRIELEPGEVDIFGIAINSFGACADGSCNERDLCGTGLFFDENGNEVARDPACLQFNYIVDNARPPRYLGITFGDQIKVEPSVDAQWGPLEFFNGINLLDRTHKGNLTDVQKLPSLQGDPAIQLTGDNLRDPVIPFPGQWFDEITLPTRPNQVRWESFFFYEDVGFQQRASRVVLNGIDQLNQDCAFPTITLNNPLNQTFNVVDVEADVSNGCNDNTPVILREGGQIIQQGTLGQIKQDLNIRVDPLTCRTIIPRLDVLDRPFMRADPPFVVHNFEPDDEDPLARLIRILDELEQELDWRVDFEPIGDPGGIAIIGTQGRGTSNILIDPSVLDPNNPYDEIAGFLIYENDDAVNSPLAVPVLTRRLPPPLPPLPLPDYDLDLPPLAQVGQQYDAGIFIPPLDPQPLDPYFNMEFFIGIETEDPGIEIEIPEPFPFVTIDENTPDEEKERLRAKFGEDPINRCSEGAWKCGKIEFGDGFTFESQIFADGFESGDVSSWSTGAAADNSSRKNKQNPVGVLDEDKKLPVFTEEELRQAIELFNDDVVFDEKTIGLVTERFGIEVPLPPIRGTYFFDEFESFRKSAQAPVTVDGSNCPAPCSGLVLEGGHGGVNGIRFENFPDHGLVLDSDSNRVTRSEFVGNGTAGVLIRGNGNVVGDSLGTANHFEGSSLAGIAVLSGTGNSFLFNTYLNIRGIDLGGDGRTANDDGDGDTGPNNLQNYPVLDDVLKGGSTTIMGSLNSTPNTTFRVLFVIFNSTTGDFRFAGETTVTADGNGDAPINVVVDGTAEIGEIVFATATDAGGNTSEFSEGFQVVTGVAAEDEPGVPTQYALFQNYPNPFNPETTIRYAVPKASRVRVEVFDMLGRQVALLVDEVKAAGAYEVVFDARDLSSGTYLYQLTGDDFVQTRKLMLVK